VAPHGTAEFRPDRQDDGVVHDWDRAFEYRSGKVAHTDYNFETPSTNLLADRETTKTLSGLKKFELFDYPGRYPKKPEGTTRAAVRIEEVEAGYDTAGGSGRCSSFAPGGKFEFTRHPADDGKYVITSVEHTGIETSYLDSRGTRSEYRNGFLCMPADVPFRPARVTPRPVVQGPQPAVVVGPSGSEIHTDKYGRIKVHFFWDRYGQKDGTDTCWIRVGELWAGKNWGMIFTPRVGQEVIVEFLEGDPDQPIVTGRVYNAEQMPPYALPANMTQSGVKTRSTTEGGTEDFNELRFEDKKGKEDIYFHAQKDFHRLVENDDDLKVGHDQTIEIKNNRTLTVKEGYEKITIDKGDRERTVSKGHDWLTVSTGEQKITIDKGKRDVEIEGDFTTKVRTGNRKVEVTTGHDELKVATGNHKIEVSSGDSLVKIAKNITIDAGMKITLKVGGNSIVIDTKAITITASKLAIAVGGSAMTFEPAKIAMSVGGSKLDMNPGKAAVAAPVLDLQGQGTAKMSGALVTVHADAVTKVDGLVVQLAGSAVSELKGAIVMIN
jgi:type VI secretion system secreted protein VgrG